MDRIPILLYLLWTLMPAQAQTIVRDATDRRPVVQASIYDEQGRIIGMTDAEGRLPQLGRSTNIRLTHIAYHPLDVQVAMLGHEILMLPVEHAMKEVVVEKGEPYCLKLMCYRRQYVINGNDTDDDVPPVVCFVDGLCDLYLFKSSAQTTRFQTLVTRNVIADEVVALGDQETLPRLTLEPMTAPVFEALAPGESQKVKLSAARDGQQTYQYIGTFNLISDTHHATYRPGTYRRKSQGDLTAYCETRRLQGIMMKRGHQTYQADLWCFDEYFPLSGEYLSKAQYRQELKERKNNPPALTAEDIDRSIAEGQVPALTAEIQQKLVQTQAGQRAVPAALDSLLTVGQRKGKLLIQFQYPDTTDSLACLLYCGGDVLETSYTAGKVLRIDCQTLTSDTIGIAIVSRRDGTLLAKRQALIYSGEAAQADSIARSLELDEVVATGRKPRPKPQNAFGMVPPRGIPVDDPRLERAASVAQLLGPLGLRVVYKEGRPSIETNSNSGLKVYLDGAVVDPDEYDDILSLPPTDVKAIEYFTPNHPQNALFGARATSTGQVPGVLFIFLKD